MTIQQTSNTRIEVYQDAVGTRGWEPATKASPQKQHSFIFNISKLFPRPTTTHLQSTVVAHRD